MTTPDPLTDPGSPDFVDPAARDRITVVGPDAFRYLQSQVSQDLTGVEVGATVWSFLLEPGGKVDALVRIHRAAEEEWVLDVDAGFGEPVLARLRRFMIRVKAELSLEPASAGQPSDAHEQARVAAGWPRMGAEIVPGETIPATTGVVPVAVSFTKGCYPGQELVERMESRGAEAPRSLRVIDAAGKAPGDPVVVDGAEVGVVTSVAPAGDLALAYIKRATPTSR